MMTGITPCRTPAFFFCQKAGKPRSISKRCFPKAHTTCEVGRDLRYISDGSFFHLHRFCKFTHGAGKFKGIVNAPLPPQCHYGAPLTRFRLLAYRWPKR